MRMRCIQMVALVLAVVLAGCRGTADIDVSGDDLVEMRRAARAYSEAWMANNPEAIMASGVA